jgi:hypothetical protein
LGNFLVAIVGTTRDELAEADAQRPLLPGALRRLKPGFLSIVTTRADQEWLQMLEEVTFLEMQRPISGSPRVVCPQNE